MKFSVLSLVLVICVARSVYASDDDAAAAPDTTVILTKENFESELKDSHYFVKFFAPWCGHCQRLMPIWSQLAEKLNGKEDIPVRIGKVDCTQENDLCSKHGVTGYPTLNFFKIDAAEPVKFRGTRDLPSLYNFINEQLEVNLKPEAEVEGDVKEVVDAPAVDAAQGLIELTDDTFGKHVALGKHFVKFYAPWCGHCQRLAPTWDELAKSLEHDPSVTVAKIDCTQYRPICQDFEVKGYPTLLWIEDGKKIEKYAGPRSHEDLKKYVEKMAIRDEPEKEQKDGGAAQKVNDTVPPQEQQNLVIQLTGATFEHGVAKGVTFIKFFAPWCGHCKRMSPTWDQLAEKYVGKAGVSIAKVDCTLADNKELCSQEQVNGFPTLFLYKDGTKITEYDGSRSLDDLFEFVAKHHVSADNAEEGGHDEL